MLTTREGSAVITGQSAPLEEPPFVSSGGVVKVKMKVQLAGYHPGPDGNSVAWPAAGEEVEVDDHEGAKLVKAGLAEPVAEKDADVKAEPVETATMPEKSEKRASHRQV